MKHSRLLAAVLVAVFLFMNLMSVSANPGILVTVEDINPSTMNPGQTATCTLSVESITNEDENLRLTINTDSALIFDWTYKEAILEAGTKENFTLEIKHNSDEVGDFPFVVDGVAWPSNWSYEKAENLGFLETSSFTANMTVVPSTVPILMYIVLACIGAAVVVVIIIFLKRRIL